MKKLLATLILTTILLPSMLLVAGCGNAEEQAEATPSLLPIQVVKPLVATLDDYYDYVGSTQAVMDVAITARVKGYLEERHFEEGSMVQKGQLLYVIEKAEYELAIKEKEADLAKNRALAIDAKREKERAEMLLKKNSISESERDKAVADYLAAEAEVNAAVAALDNAKRNLAYCSIVAPIKGRIGETLVNKGNLVGDGQSTKLATVVQQDPIYVTFSVPTKRFGDYVKSYLDKEKIFVEVRTENGKLYSPDEQHNKKEEKSNKVYRTVVDFANNQINPTTATILLRATVDNRNMMLIPNEFVKVRAIVGKLKNQILVPTKAIFQQQGGAFVYVVKKDGKCIQKAVELGKIFGDLQVVREGITKDDQIAIAKLMMLRNDMVVKPEMQKPLVLASAQKEYITMDEPRDVSQKIELPGAAIDSTKKAKIPSRPLGTPTPLPTTPATPRENTTPPISAAKPMLTPVMVPEQTNHHDVPVTSPKQAPIRRVLPPGSPSANPF